MTIAVGDVVKFANGDAKGELGRVCKDNGITVCVHFKAGGCLRVAKGALEVTDGVAPECSGNCTEGC